MQLVIEYGQRPMTTSLLVADRLGRQHKHILQSIRELDCSDSFRQENYVEGTYPDSNGMARPLILMTKDGFANLLMTFKGEVAARFREEFIEEFKRMEEALRFGSTPSLIPTYQSRILSNPTKSLPFDHWCVFSESHPIMLFVEANIGSVNKYDLVDASIGKRWAEYRRDKEWATTPSTYIHDFADNRGEVDCACFQMGELAHFRRWLHEEYKAKHLLTYLVEKFKRDKQPVMLQKVREVMPRLLAA